MRDVGKFLSDQQNISPPELAAQWAQLEEFYNKRLWHQCTQHLLSFVRDPALLDGDILVKLYENVIADFEHRINPLSLTEICLHVVNQIKDIEDSVKFLDKLRDKVKASDEAVILCMTAKATLKLQQKDLDDVKALIEEAEGILDRIDGVTRTHGRYYDLSSSYYQLLGDHAKYYRDALRFLGCIDLDEITVDEQKTRAFNLGLAAVLGEGIYNFGELLAHPVLKTLQATDKAWLVQLLFAFNSGDIVKFEGLKSVWSAQPDLKCSEVAMRQKICMLCLMEMTFTRPSHKRNIAFSDIAEQTGLPLNEVEILIMKALSLELVKGSINEVDQVVNMVWVQPRVLDLNQVGTMQERLRHWCDDVQSMESFMENKGSDILA